MMYHGERTRAYGIQFPSPRRCRPSVPLRVHIIPPLPRPLRYYIFPVHTVIYPFPSSISLPLRVPSSPSFPGFPSIVYRRQNVKNDSLMFCPRAAVRSSARGVQRRRCGTAAAHTKSTVHFKKYAGQRQRVQPCSIIRETRDGAKTTDPSPAGYLPPRLRRPLRFLSCSPTSSPRPNRARAAGRVPAWPSSGAAACWWFSPCAYKWARTFTEILILLIVLKTKIGTQKYQFSRYCRNTISYKIKYD